MRHHYVPQFLLHAWADTTADKKVQVFRLDLKHLPSSRLGPKHTGYEDDLYALTLPVVRGMEKHAVEKQFLSRVDSDAACVRRKMAEAGLKPLSLDERSAWVCFLMSLRLRQPEIVFRLREETADHLRQTLNAHPEEYEASAEGDDPPTLEEWTNKHFPGLIENFGLSFFHKLALDTNISSKFFHMKWWLWDFSKTNHSLLLADQPCIVTSSLDGPDCMVALPISPHKAFMATQSERVAAIMRNQDPKDLVKRINVSSLFQARTRIYARDKSAERFIRNRALNRLAK